MQSEIPILQRPDQGGKLGSKVMIRVNLFPIKPFGNEKKHEIWQYDISINELDPKPRENEAGEQGSPFDPTFNRKVLGFVQQKFNVFERFPYAYDGKHLLYTTNELQLKNGHVEHQFEHENPVGRKKTFVCKITLAKSLSANSLRNFIEKGGEPPKFDILAALNIFTKAHGLASGNYHQERDTLYQNKSVGKLGGLLEAREGYFSAMKATQGGLMLNVNLATGAFYEPVPLVQIIARILDVRDPNQMAGMRFNERQIKDLNRYLKNISVDMKHSTSYARRITIQEISAKSASEYFFETDGKNLSVKDYFKSQYNIDLRYPNCPCVVKNGRAFPVEFCSITSKFCKKKLDANQTANMIRFAGMKPHERQKKINQGIEALGLARNNFFKDLGMQMSPEMLRVESRILPPGKLMLSKMLQISNGGWNMKDVKLYRGASISNWAVLDTTGKLRIDAAKNFIFGLLDMCKRMGMEVHPAERNFYNCQSNEFAVEKKIEEIVQKQKVSLLICVVEGSSAVYRAVKRCGDSKFGFASQCVLADNVRKKGGSPQFLSNLILKINGKMGGINAKFGGNLPKLTEKSMLLGADITHPTGGGKNETRPSICAVVASMDPEFSTYSTVVRQQATRLERAGDLKNITKELLDRFKKKNGFYPDKLVMIRDGVSDSELVSIYQEEVLAMRSAFSEIDNMYRPLLTFIVAQKRTTLRFFPDNRDQADRSGNIKSGTVVDTVIVHPREYDFYMQSHAGIQGTTVPVHYYVIKDDNKYTSDEIQVLVDGLCSLSARSTRTCSVCAPALYAHLAAFRGRLLSKIDLDTSDNQSMMSISSNEMFELNRYMDFANYFL